MTNMALSFCIHCVGRELDAQDISFPGSPQLIYHLSDPPSMLTVTVVPGSPHPTLQRTVNHGICYSVFSFTCF